MKLMRLPYLAAVLLLSGCAHDTVPQNAVVQAPATPPAGMFKLLEDAELATYVDARSVALYKGNPHLRQFYLINNYLGAAVRGDDPPRILSSRATRVINCEQDQMAQLGRVYYPQPFALGQEVTRKTDTPQWKKFERQSLIGILRDSVCKLDASRLRPGNPE